jgi:hypothetical protein
MKQMVGNDGFTWGAHNWLRHGGDTSIGASPTQGTLKLRCCRQEQTTNQWDKRRFCNSNNVTRAWCDRASLDLATVCFRVECTAHSDPCHSVSVLCLNLVNQPRRLGSVWFKA